MARGKRRAAKGPDALDAHIGQRIRRRRQMLGVNQRSIAERLGKTFQAVQKYERAENRVAASTLIRIAMILGVTLDYFVAELPDGLLSIAPLPESDEWIVPRRGRSLGAVIEEAERVALRAVRPLMALPPEIRAAMIGHITWLARALGKGEGVAEQDHRDDG
jgi:transcriptional regulator with XRE-family HTH domain